MTLHNPSEEELKQAKFPSESEYSDFFKIQQNTLNLVLSLTDSNDKPLNLTLGQLQVLCKVLMDNLDCLEITFFGLCVVFAAQKKGVSNSPIFGDTATAVLHKYPTTMQVAGIALRTLGEVIKSFPEYPVNSALLMRVSGGESKRLVFGLLKNYDDVLVQYAYSTIFNSEDDVAIQQALVYLSRGEEYEHAEEALIGICEIGTKRVKSDKIISGLSTFFQSQHEFPESLINVLDLAFQTHFLNAYIVASICICSRRLVKAIPAYAKDQVLLKIASHGLQSEQVSMLKASVDLLLVLERKDKPIADISDLLTRCTKILKSYPSTVFDLLMRYVDSIPSQALEIISQEYLVLYTQPTCKFISLHQKRIDNDCTLWPGVLHGIFAVLVFDELTLVEVKTVLKLLDEFLRFGEEATDSARGKADKLKLVKDVEISDSGAIAILGSLMIKFETDENLIAKIIALFYRFILLKSVRETLLHSETVSALLSTKSDRFKDDITKLLLDGVQPVELIKISKPKNTQPTVDNSGFFGFWGTSDASSAQPTAQQSKTTAPAEPLESAPKTAAKSTAKAAELKDTPIPISTVKPGKKSEAEKTVKEATDWFDAGVAMLSGDNGKMEKLQRKQEKRRDKAEIKRAVKEEKKRIEEEKKAKELALRKQEQAKAIAAARLRAQKEAEQKKKGCLVQ